MKVAADHAHLAGVIRRTLTDLVFTGNHVKIVPGIRIRSPDHALGTENDDIFAFRKLFKCLFKLFPADRRHIGPAV